MAVNVGTACLVVKLAGKLLQRLSNSFFVKHENKSFWSVALESSENSLLDELDAAEPPV